METLPFVSVVVPTRNRAGLLRDSLNSLLAQDFPADRCEIIVVDDGSTDETPEVVRRAAQAAGARAVRYVVSPGRGLNIARNAGIAVALGDPIAFVDDDVDVPSSWMRKVVEGVQRYADVLCFGGEIRLRLEARFPHLCGRERLGETDLELGQEERVIPLARGTNMILRRRSLALVGLFNEALSGWGDEGEWELRLQALGGTVFYLPQAWLWHRRTAPELRLSALMRARFSRGRMQVVFARLVGHNQFTSEFTVVRALLAIPRLLGHALARRCLWGVLAATELVGRLWQFGVDTLHTVPASVTRGVGSTLRGL